MNTIDRWSVLRMVCACVNVLIFSCVAKADFIENRGQWPAQVLFSADIPGGKLFIEKNRLLYCFMESTGHAHLGNSTGKNISHGSEENLWAHAYEVKFLNCRINPEVLSRVNTGGTIYNYIGVNESQSVSGARSFLEIKLRELYTGIDLVLYSTGTNVKYDLVVRPEGHVSNIHLEYNGVDNMFIDNENLLLKTRLGESMEMKPYTYQQVNGNKTSVRCLFHVKDNRVSFKLPDGFDRSLTLVIDPMIIFSAYSGSTSDNWGNTATYDDDGNLYSAGTVATIGYPTTLGAYQISHAGGSWDIGIMKFDSAGSRLLYATYLGGNATETPQSLVVNKAGELLILGTTSSRNFPVTNGSVFGGGRNFTPMDGVRYTNGSDIFVAKLNSTGTRLLGATFIGGSNNDGINFVSGEFDTPAMVQSPLCRNYGDQFRGDIITDSNNNVYIASNTTSTDFPAVNTGTTYRGGSHDAVVVKLKSDLSGIVWSRFLGGSDTDAAYSIKLGEQDTIFVAGGTQSTDFAGMNGYKATSNGGIDGWVASLSPDGSQVTAATYIGTSSYDQAYFVDLNTDGDVYLFGQTKGRYPVSGNVFSQTNGGQFIHKLSKDLKTSVFSTVFGSGGNSPNISPTAFLVSDCNKIYVAGWGGVLNTTTVTISRAPAPPVTITRNFVGGNTRGLRVSSDAYQSTTTGEDFYLMVLDEDASAFLYGTFLGGGRSVTHVDGGTSRFDKRGIVYHAVCAGCGGLSDFPSVNAPAGHKQNKAITGAQCNNAAFKFDLALLGANLLTNSVDFDAPGIDTLCFPSPIVFENLSSGAKYYEWDLGDGTVMTTSTIDPVTHTYKDPGVYLVKLTAFNNETCEGSDVASVVVSIFDPDVDVSDDSNLCQGSSLQLVASGGASYLWKNKDGTFITNSSHPIVSPTDTAWYYVTITDESGCQLTDSVKVSVVPAVEYSFETKKHYDCWNRPSAYFFYTITANESDYSFTWNFGDGSTSTENPVTHAYDADSTYTVTLNAANEYCSYQSTQQLTITTLKVPNIITLNGDEKNDKLIIKGEHVDLQVFNRWGKPLYQQENYQNTWPSTSLDSGVYYYRVDIQGETTCKGWIQLVR